MFINYKNGEIIVRNWRLPEATVCTLEDMLMNVEEEAQCIECCPLEGAEGALCDGEWLSTLNVSQEAVEELYEAIEGWDSEREYETD